MRHDHLKRELDLLLLLTQNRHLPTSEICRRVGISQRSFYYYIDFFEQSGFIVEKHSGCYSIDRTSSFFTRLCDIIQFTEDEAMLMRQLIDQADTADKSRLADLRAKFNSFYDYRILADEQVRRRVGKIRSVMYEAVKRKRMVEIQGYSSPSSHTVSDRSVEPFQFLRNNTCIRCYEPSTGKNKTFRLSRMEAAVLTDSDWEHESEHRTTYTDLFSFTGEEVMPVSLIMGQLSHNLMLEEYPESLQCFTEAAGGRWAFRADVCSYLGIGRFVLGLLDDIVIEGDDGFREYVNAKVAQWQDIVRGE